MIEVEIQNETHQTQERLRFAAVPRIGEGIRLREPNGFWASYDVVDLWYQQADYGDIWIPYLHVRMTPADRESALEKAQSSGPPDFSAHIPLAEQLEAADSDFCALEIDPFKG